MSKANPSAPAAAQAVQLDSVLDAMIESMIVIDEEGIMEQINKATSSMFGYEPSELLGQNISMLMSGSDHERHDNYLSHYMKTGKKRIIGRGREVLGRRKDGSVFPASIAVGEIKTDTYVRFVGLIRDLTQQRQAEEQALKQREEMVNVSRLSMMGEMAAAMAHELNQPLTAIANYASASMRLLEQSPDNIADVREVLQEINDQAHRAGEVIQRTREFTRTGDESMASTTLADIAAPIRSLAELDTNANNIRLSWNLPEDLPEVEADAVQIQQIILNLIRNAVDAMHDTDPEHRDIEIEAKITAPHEIRLDVRDHGHGVSPEAARDIFNAFFTTKSSGMGMGLAICRTIIRAHGGELGFRNNNSTTGKTGATFYFTIPTRV
ncbi:MAG: two-component system sensor histidine kinase NtrB [Gammaproteobacteria bacterium]